MATFYDLPPELLSIIAAAPNLTNHDRKQARLACSNLTAAMTPVIFRRAYISWIKTDRNAFLSLAATPYLAAHVEEVIWFELECDWLDLENLSNDLEGVTELRADLLTSAQGLCWPPIARPLEQFEHHGNIEIFSTRYLKHSEAENLVQVSAQFKAAVALMPKLHTFSSEPMPWHRTVRAHLDSYPFHVGLMSTHGVYGGLGSCSDYLRFFLEAINEENGRITRLHCVDQTSSSLLRDFSGHGAAFKFLTSFEYSIAAKLPHRTGDTFRRRTVLVDVLQAALFQASQLQELSITWDYGPEAMRTRKPLSVWGLFIENSGEAHRWQHLRSLKLGYVDIKPASTSFLSVIEAHVGTLRHLHLEQCRPAQSFALELSQLSGLQLSSITISHSETPKDGLISEQELLRFIHHGDTDDKKQARKIARGKFVTHNRRPDNDIDDEPFEDYDSESDHSSEWWSDSDSESGLEAVSASNIMPPTYRRRNFVH